MEKIDKNDTVSGDIEDIYCPEDGEIDEEDEDIEETEEAAEERDACARPSGLEVWKKRLPVIAIYARYFLPVLTALVLLILSCCDLVYFYMVGASYKMSLFAFLKSTLSAAIAYVGEGNGDYGAFYAVQTIGAVIFIAIHLLAIFFSVFAAVTACRAFRAGHESRESNRMKIAFKIAFPNRIALFLANLTLILPTLHPYYFAAVGKAFDGGSALLFIAQNVPLIVVGVLLALTLALAMVTPRFERRKKMNMFLIFEPDADASEGCDNSEE